MAKLKKDDLEIGMKFKSKAQYYNGYTFKVVAIDKEKNSIDLELRDSGKRYFETQQKKLDAFIFDVNFECYEKINERPEPIENEGAYAD